MSRSCCTALAILVMPFLVASGCGGDENSAADGSVAAADADPLAPDADPLAADAIPSSEFSTLVSLAWTIPPGSEIYRCTRVTVAQDTYISGFRGLSPLGTHHTVLSRETNPSEPDGDFNCNAGTNAHAMLFASGVGTDDMVFPQGTAMKVTAGTQLLLNLHLFNTSDTEITGTSGTQVMTSPASAVQQEAEFLFTGTFAIGISGEMPGEIQTASGGCTFSQDQTIIALWPHMHQLGVHMKFTHGSTVLHDEAYDFNDQINYTIAPTLVKAGEQVRTECSFINNTGSPVTFGDSSDKEMCFTGMYLYPATNAGLFDCAGF